MGLFNKKSAAEKLYDADKAVRTFSKSKKSFNEKDYKKFHGLLEKRAKTMSDVYGVKISPIFSSTKEAKKFRERNK